jgi:hypothetical protein
VIGGQCVKQRLDTKKCRAKPELWHPKLNISSYCGSSVDLHGRVAW